MTVIILAVVFVLCLFLYHHFTVYNNFWKQKNVPGPEPTFFFGNIKESVLRRKPVGLVFKEIYDMYPDEPVVGFFRMRCPDLLVRDLDVIKHILIKDFNVFTDRGKEFSKSALGANLFHADTETWKVLRKCFTPLFTPGKLRNMMDLLTKHADRFVEYVDRITRVDHEQEIHGLVQKFTQAAIAACVFGVDFDNYEDQEETLQMIDKEIFSAKYGAELEMMYPGILKKVGGCLFSKKVKTFFFDLIKAVITKREDQPSKRQDFMDLLLGLRKYECEDIPGQKKENDGRELQMSDEDIAAQAYIFYAAGYESSASTMGFLLYQLALNQDIQDKLYEEVKKVLERHAGQLTYENIMEMTYMAKVFKETLRMHPIVTKLKRRANRTYNIPGTNVILDKDQLIKISIMGIHYDEKYYPNPEVFDPERFSPENVKARHQCAFLPFGLGPKNCIGIRFAQMQSWVGLVKLLSRFRVEPSEHTPFHFEYEPKRVMLYPKGGFPIKIVKRC